MNKPISLSEIYPYNPHTQTFSIPARLSYYKDFFNPMDPSPATARDLSPELVNYLDQCTEEIPIKYSIAVLLEIQNEVRDALEEEGCLIGLRNFYQHAIFLTQAQIQHKRTHALKYLLMSFTCLTIYLLTESLNAQLFILNLIREAILIGGWVFMWEAVTLNFIEMDNYWQEIQKYRRLIKATIGFKYGNKNG